MLYIIILFYLSLATIIIMVGWKLVSLRKLKLSLIEGVEKEFHGKFYEISHRLWYALRVKYFTQIRTLIVQIFYVIAHEILRVVGIWGQKLKERHSKWFDMVKGKGEVNNKNGSVSFFLQDVSEYKKSIKSEDIEL